MTSPPFNPGDIIREKCSRQLWRVMEVYRTGALRVRRADEPRRQRVILHPEEYRKVEP